MKTSLGAKPLLYPTPVLVVGTYDPGGKPNAMVCAWGGICCSTPPCVAVALRKATYSHACILERKAFTVSIPSETYVRQTDYLGIVSGRDEDKFAATGLTPVRSSLVDAPFVGEFPLVLECRLFDSVEIGLHTEFIGEILDVKVDAAMLDSTGNPDLSRLQPMVYAPGSRAYHAVGAVVGPAFAIGRKQ